MGCRAATVCLSGGKKRRTGWRDVYKGIYAKGRHLRECFLTRGDRSLWRRLGLGGLEDRPRKIGGKVERKGVNTPP